MKRKEYMIFRYAFLLVSVLLLGAACSGDDDKDDFPPTDDGAEVIARFKDYFYEEDGEVRANQLRSYQPAEWSLATEEPQKPLEVFMKITGMSPDAAMKSEYEYRYQSSGGKCAISIKGRAEADADGVFATMSVDIPEYKDIKTMHFVSMDYFEELNSSEIVTGVPVIYAE